ncbi:MAG: hypothetical protein ACRETA_04150 [Gammaproteobacteria bacterium]
MAIAAIQSRIAWQPNPLGSVSIGILASALVLAALVFIFSDRIETETHPAPMEVRLISFKSVPHTLHKTRIKLKSPVERLPALQPIKPIAIQKIQLPQQVNWQQQMDMAVQEYEPSGSKSSEFMVKQNPTDTILEKALQFRPKQPILQNDEAYRSIYGYTVLKSDGLCTELQTIQFGPSPSDRVTVASIPPHPCTGEQKPTMSEELSKWADKRKAELSKPPR